MGVDLFGKSWEQLGIFINNANERMKESSDIIKDGTLKDLFNDADYQSNVEGYEKHLSSLTSALETLRSEGSLTAEQMRDLQEEMPNLTDFSVEGISKAAAGELSQWISEFKSGWTDLSEEEEKQLDTYLANFTASYRNIAISEADVRKELSKVASAQGGEEWVQENKIQQNILALKEKYGEDLNWSVILTLKDLASGDTEEFLQKYKDYTLVWDLEVKLDNAKNQIENLTANRNVNKSEQDYRSALGIAMTAEDYEKDNSISDGLIKYYQEQIDIAEQDLANNPDAADWYKDAVARKISGLQQSIYGEMAT